MLDFNTFNEVGFHNAVKASVQHARKTAIASRRYVCVTVTPGTGSAGKLAILQDTIAPESVGTVNCTSAVSLPAASTVAGCAVNEVCAPDGVTLGGASFIIDPLGRPVAADRSVLGAVTSFTVASATGSQPPISIQPNTGLVD